MKKIILNLLIFAQLFLSLVAQSALPGIKLQKEIPGGWVGVLDGGQRLLCVSGSPESMGATHGELLKKELAMTVDCLHLMAAKYSFSRNEWFYDRIREIELRGGPFVPPEYLRECDVMSETAGISITEGRAINFFSEIFHCSGLAVRGRASVDGRVRHVRVLDYLRDIGLQKSAAVIVYVPNEKFAWVSVGYAGFIGTVTAMNEAGVVMGEMGGDGEGKWDGIPMNFLMRLVMEKCSSVAEALTLLNSLKHTCEYYYLLSDRSGDMAAVIARAGEPLQIVRPGEKHSLLPAAYADVVYISAGRRLKHLSDRISANYGRIDINVLQEMIRHPVAMSSNLHNAIFEPETLDFYWSNAGRNTPACDEPYAKLNLRKVVDFERQRILKRKTIFSRSVDKLLSKPKYQVAYL